MKKYEGKIVEIECVYGDSVRLKNIRFTWDKRAFEPINLKPTKKELLKMPDGIIITTDTDCVLIKANNEYFYDYEDCCLCDSDINDDLTIDDDDFGTRIVKIEEPKYETYYEEVTKEMTIDEIEKELGYKIKIIEEEK